MQLLYEWLRPFHVESRKGLVAMRERYPSLHRLTLGADRAYATREFVEHCRLRGITLHVACRQRSHLDRRTTRHPSFGASQRARKRIKEVFGWIKSVGGGRKLRYRGVARNQLWAGLTVATYDLVRMVKLLFSPPAPRPAPDC